MASRVLKAPLKTIAATQHLRAFPVQNALRIHQLLPAALSRKLGTPHSPLLMADALLLHSDRLSLSETIAALRVCRKCLTRYMLPSIASARDTLLHTFVERWASTATFGQLTAALRTSSLDASMPTFINPTNDAVRRLVRFSMERLPVKERNLETLAVVASCSHMISSNNCEALEERLWACIDLALGDMIAVTKDKTFRERVDVIIQLLLSASGYSSRTNIIKSTTLPLLFAAVRKSIDYAAPNRSISPAHAAALVKIFGYLGLHHWVFFRSCSDLALHQKIWDLCRLHLHSFRHQALHDVLEGCILWKTMLQCYSDSEYADLEQRLNPLFEDLIHKGLLLQSTTLNESHCYSLLQRRASVSTKANTSLTLHKFICTMPCGYPGVNNFPFPKPLDSVLSEDIFSPMTDAWFQSMLCQRAVSCIVNGDTTMDPSFRVQLAFEIAHRLNPKGEAQRNLLAALLPSVLRALNLETLCYEVLTDEECKQKVSAGIVVLELLLAVGLRPAPSLLQRCLPMLRRFTDSIPLEDFYVDAQLQDNEVAVPITVAATASQLARLLSILSEFRLADTVDALALFPLLSGLQFSNVEDAITTLESLGRFMDTCVPKTLLPEFVAPVIRYLSDKELTLTSAQRDRLNVHLSYLRSLGFSTSQIDRAVQRPVKHGEEDRQSLCLGRHYQIIDEDVVEWDAYLRHVYGIDTALQPADIPSEDSDRRALRLHHVLSVLGPRPMIQPEEVHGTTTPQRTWKRTPPSSFAHRINAALEAFNKSGFLEIDAEGVVDHIHAPFVLRCNKSLFRVQPGSWTQHQTLHQMMKDEPILWTLLGDERASPNPGGPSAIVSTNDAVDLTVVLLPVSDMCFYNDVSFCDESNTCVIHKLPREKALRRASHEVYRNYLERHGVRIVEVYCHEGRDSSQYSPASLSQLLYDRLRNIREGLADKCSSLEASRT